VDSPNYLCALTETVADLTNARTTALDFAPSAHPLEATANTMPASEPARHAAQRYHGQPPPTTRSLGPLRPPLIYTDVYMDDFLVATQHPDRSAVLGTLFECIDSVLRPLSPNDNPCRKEPISIKKLQKGDACWTTRKSILGWLIDTTGRTIKLPPHRLERLHEILASFPTSQHRTSRRKWQQLLGELRSMVLAIPGGRGLFSQLQSVLTHSENPKPFDHLRLSRPVHDRLRISESAQRDGQKSCTQALHSWEPWMLRALSWVALGYPLTRTVPHCYGATSSLPRSAAAL
jgi:hypothetical protein